MLLPFSLLFAIANIQFKYTELPIAARVGIHYAFTMLGVMCCLYLPNRNSGAGASQGLILFLAVSVLYAIAMGGFLGVRARIHRVTRDATRYQSLYKSKENSKINEQEKNGSSAKNRKNDKDTYQNVFKKN